MQMCFFVTQNVIFRAYCLIVVVVTVVITSKGFSLQRGIFNLDASLRCTTSHRWQKCDNDPISWPRALPVWIQDPALFPWGGSNHVTPPILSAASLSLEVWIRSIQVSNKPHKSIGPETKRTRSRKAFYHILLFCTAARETLKTPLLVSLTIVIVRAFQIECDVSRLKRGDRILRMAEIVSKEYNIYKNYCLERMILPVIVNASDW